MRDQKWKLPYYAVIFTSEHSDNIEGYDEFAARMEALSENQKGYLGIESVRSGSFGITVSYWESEEAIQNWKNHVEHLQAQALGKKKWYAKYTVRVAKVERHYSFKS